MDDSNTTTSTSLQDVLVTSAVALTNVEKTELLQILEQKLKTKVQLKYKVDKSTITGMRLRVGDKVFDQTLKNKLDILKERLQK